MYKIKRNIQISPKNSLIFFSIVSVIMFLFMFKEQALRDDGLFHLGRLVALSEDLSWRNMKPWIYSGTNFNTGYPLGIFYPDLFLYPFALLAKTPIGYYGSFVIMIMAINCASVISFYLCVRKIMIYRKVEGYDRLAFAMACMYLIFPYRLWCLYIRIALGECMFYVFFPIVMLGIYELFYNRRFSLTLFVGMIGMGCSHILSTVIAIVVLVIFYLVNIKTIIKCPKIIIYTGINAICTICCALSLILPPMEMQGFVKMYYATGEKTFGELVDNTLRIVNNENLSIVITLIVLVVSCVAVYKGNNKVKLLVVSLISLFVCTDMFCWEWIEKIFPMANMLQFPYRLLGIASFPISMLLGYKLYKHKPLYIGFTLIMIMAFVILAMGAYLPIKDIDLMGKYSIGRGEYAPVELREYLAMNNMKIPDVENEYSIERKGDEYTFVAKDNKVVLPLGYYKGYKITDGTNEYEYTINTGLIEVKNVKINKLIVTYEGTVIQKVSLIFSLVSAILIAVIVICQTKTRKYKVNSVNKATK